MIFLILLGILAACVLYQKIFQKKYNLPPVYWIGSVQGINALRKAPLSGNSKEVTLSSTLQLGDGQIGSGFITFLALLYFLCSPNVGATYNEPCPKGWPILGNLPSIGGRPYITFDKFYKEHGKIFTIHVGNIRHVVLGDPKLIKEVYNDPKFSGRFDRMMINILSKGNHGIVASSGQEWVDQRRFTLRHLRDFGFGKNLMEQMIMEEVNDFISWLKSEEGNPISTNERFELAVLNSLWVILTGKRFRHDDHENLGLLRDIDRYFTKPNRTGIVNLFFPSLLNKFPGLTGYNFCKSIANRFHKVILEVVEEHEKTLPEEGHPRDFIDAYLHEIKKTTDPKSSFYKDYGMTSLLAVVGDMYFAGSETTSATMAWAMLYLALHPKVQEKLQEEIDQVVGSARQVTLNDKNSMPYSEAVLLEILRKSSIVVTGVMHTAVEDTQIMGYDIPKDTWISPNIYAIHHDPEIWGDPHNFRPERFLSADGEKVEKNDNLLPFSLGKRRCLGENLARDEIYLFVTNIFQRFKVTLDPSRPKPHMGSIPGFILKPEEHYLIVSDRFR